MRTTRRRVLAYGVAGAALLALGGVLRVVTRSYALPAGELPPVALSIKELVVVRAIVQALHPGDALSPAGLALGIDRMIDEEVYSQTPEFAADAKAGIQLLEHAPPLVGVFSRLTELDDAARSDVLDGLARRGPAVVVQAAVFLRQAANAFYFGDDRSWAAIGYDGPWQQVSAPHPSSARYQRALAALAKGATP